MGVLAYELLAYRKPFRGEHLSTILYKILNETPEPHRDARPGRAARADRGGQPRDGEEPADRYPTMEEFRKDLQAVYRELAGGSGTYPVTQALPDTVRTPRPDVADEDPTLATPSSGVAPAQHHAALRRARARARARPTRRRPPASISGGARPPLELVNFRDPTAADAGEATTPRVGRTGGHRETRPARSRKTRLTILAALLVLGVAGAEIYRLLQSRAARPAPARGPGPPPRPAPRALRPPRSSSRSPSSARARRPKPPRAARAARPRRRPRPLRLPAPPAAPEKPAVARKFKVQFSSVPVATLSVDGRTIGPSIPARTHPLDEGEHTVRFEAKGFPPHERKFQVGPKADEPHPLPVPRLDARHRGAGLGRRARARRRQVSRALSRRGAPQASAGHLQRDALPRRHRTP